MSGRLIHLNGPPGVGKSTLAARYAEEHPGTLCCDIDVLRTLLGGWRHDWGGSGELIRPVARSMIATHVAAGHDVVLPQLVARAGELERFRRAAADVGGEVVLVFLDAADAALCRRWRGRSGGDAWTATSAEVIDSLGGDELVTAVAGQLRSLAGAHPEAHALHAPEGEVEATYGALLRLLR